MKFASLYRLILFVHSIDPPKSTRGLGQRGTACTPERRRREKQQRSDSWVPPCLAYLYSDNATAALQYSKQDDDGRDDSASIIVAVNTTAMQFRDNTNCDDLKIIEQL